MEIEVLASSSAGNAYAISDGQTSLLLEAGIRFADLRRGLGFGVSQLAACLISHSHADHSRAVPELMKAGIDCFMSQATAEEIGAAGHRVQIIEPLRQFRLGTWTILPFPAVHDVECLGFLLAGQAGKLLYLTDSAYCRYRFQGLTHLLIEANYSSAILRRNVADGLVPLVLKNRILRNHMSIERLLEFLAANDLSRVSEIHLLHLSRDNSDEALFKRRVQEATGRLVTVAQA